MDFAAAVFSFYAGLAIGIIVRSVWASAKCRDCKSEKMFWVIRHIKDDNLRDVAMRDFLWR